MSSYMKPEVVLEYPLFQSNKGNYFIGQTPFLTGPQAYVALVNPACSHVNIYVNAITLTNTSACNTSAEIYLRTSFEGGSVSDQVTCVNTSISPSPTPEGHIQSVQSVPLPPADGVPIFSRISSPESTLVIDGSQIIIGAGQSLLIYLGGFMPICADSIKVALGWWEERDCKPHCYRCVHF